MSGTAIVEAILQILFSGLTQTGTAIGAGISSMVTALVYTTTGTGTDAVTTLSPFFILVVVFAAISLGLALCRWVLNFATSFGQRNR